MEKSISRMLEKHGLIEINKKNKEVVYEKE